MKRSYLSLLTVAVAAGLLVPTISAGAETPKFAFIDRMRALNETNEGKVSMAKLEKLKKSLQDKVKGREEEIMKLKETLEKQQNVLTKEALQKKAEEYYKGVSELQQSYGQFQKELSDKEAEFTKDILIKMDGIATEIGKSDGYTMIFDRTTMVWAPAHLDLTDKLIQLYNEKYKVKETKTTTSPATKKN